MTRTRATSPAPPRPALPTETATATAWHRRGDARLRDVGTVPGPDGDPPPAGLTDRDDAQVWEARRKEFVRFCTVRAGGSYGLGCHDEWNSLVRLNGARAGHPA